MATNGSEVRPKRFSIKLPLLVALVVCAVVIGGATLRKTNTPKAAAAVDPVEEASAATSPTAGGGGSVKVEVVKPKQGGPPKTTTQKADVHAFAFAELYSKVSGFVKVQKVDIGSKVRRGQLLVKIDDPELDVEVEQAAAGVAEAKAHVEQMTAMVATAKANAEAATATIAQSKAELKRAAAFTKFKEQQFARVKKLFDLNSVEKELVDEKENDMLAARAAEDAAKAAIITAEAHALAAVAQIDQAKADLLDAQSKVHVMESALKKAEVFAQYTEIVSPYDGVITKRNFNIGDFIRAAERGGDVPLLAVAETDVMRVVVPIPDTQVRFADPGDLATVKVDELPGVTFSGKISRIANAEDSQSRTMRVEIDLPNPSGKLFPGMYGEATIVLEPGSNNLTIPSSSLVGKEGGGKGSVYVVRGGKAQLTPVEVVADDGLEIEIGKGLTAQDEVVVKHNGSIGNGVAVEISNSENP